MVSIPTHTPQRLSTPPLTPFNPPSTTFTAGRTERGREERRRAGSRRRRRRRPRRRRESDENRREIRGGRREGCRGGREGVVRAGRGEFLFDRARVEDAVPAARQELAADEARHLVSAVQQNDSGKLSGRQRGAAVERGGGDGVHEQERRARDARAREATRGPGALEAVEVRQGGVTSVGAPGVNTDGWSDGRRRRSAGGAPAAEGVDATRRDATTTRRRRTARRALFVDRGGRAEDDERFIASCNTTWRLRAFIRRRRYRRPLC